MCAKLRQRINKRSDCAWGTFARADGSRFRFTLRTSALSPVVPGHANQVHPIEHASAPIIPPLTSATTGLLGERAISTPCATGEAAI